jgi:thymidylate synthase
MTNSTFEHDYKNLLLDTLSNGELESNRTSVKTYKTFNRQLNIDLQKGFPILTSKRVSFEKGLGEFKWIYEGRTDLEFLHEYNVKWWDGFLKDGSLGKTYGYQVRSFNGVFDQVEYVINEINNNSRRAIITLWNPSDLNDQPLPCCYTSFNFVRIGNKLNMVMNFRSSDLFLGLPYDIIVGSLFLTKIAEECNLIPSMLGLNLADAHIYESHRSQTLEYCNSKVYSLPTLYKENNEYTLTEYESNGWIKAPLIK